LVGLLLPEKVDEEGALVLKSKGLGVYWLDLSWVLLMLMAKGLVRRVPHQFELRLAGSVSVRVVYLQHWQDLAWLQVLARGLEQQLIVSGIAQPSLLLRLLVALGLVRLLSVSPQPQQIFSCDPPLEIS
jgi:hypothetical protein